METKVERLVSKDMIIQDILDTFPGKAQKLTQVMTNSGLNCVGCNASTNETLEQGILGHGYSEKELNSLLENLNQVVEENVEIKEMAVTKLAAEKINVLLEKENKKGWGMKVSLESGGCSGNQYYLGFQESAKEGEKTIESNGVKLFVEEKYLENLNGAEIDYVDGLMGAGFKINNPNVTKSCSCGNSVGF